MTNLNVCVQNCGQIAYNYVNNENNRQCQYCGPYCTQCSQQYGCIQDWAVGHGFTQLTPTIAISTSLLPNTPTFPGSNFTTAVACADPRCQSCSTYNNSTLTIPGIQFNFQQCDSCWDSNNIYYDVKTQKNTCVLCNSKIANCVQCNYNQPNTTCVSCATGYYLQSNQCIKSTTTIDGCVQYTSNPTFCQQCAKGYVLLPTGGCQQCNLSSFNTNNNIKNVRCTQCKANAINQCLYCDVGFLKSISSPNTCQLTCDPGQFAAPVSSINVPGQIYTSTECQACDRSCLTCVLGDSNSCLTCSNTNYLLIQNIKGQTGKCMPKLQNAPSQPIEIYVTNVIPANASLALAQPNIGSYTNPLFDFLFALSLAQDLTAQYATQVQVNIYLTKGDHYVIQDRGDTILQFQHTTINGITNLNQNINISPIPCSKNLPNVLNVCTSSSVNIHNKVRELFEIQVPANMTISNINIDSLDSLISRSGDPCYALRKQCCTQTNQVVSTIPGAAAAGVCENAVQQFQKSFEASCIVNSYHTMFRMALNNLGDVSKPNTLNLSNTAISNVYYAMNSLIALTQIQGIVNIQGSQFTSISICGGIIKNTFVESVIPQVLTHINQQVLSTPQAQNILLKQSIEIGNTYISPNLVPSNLACSSTTCFSITINTSTFSSFFSQTQPEQSYNMVSSANGMQFQGLVLNLNGFNGPVSVTASQFTNNIIPYNTCNLVTPGLMPSLNNFIQLSNPLTTFNNVQIQSLIQIANSQNINITSNSFSGNVMTQGVMRLDQNVGQTQIVGNQFNLNTAVTDYAIMVVRQCSGVTLTLNTFNQNIGCGETGGISLQCVNQLNMNNFNFDPQFNTYDILNGQQGFKASQISLNSNVYTQNFVGSATQFLAIEGFQNVNVVNDTFTSNENFLPQSFSSLSPMNVLLSNANEMEQLTTLVGYDNKAQAILKITASSNVVLSQVSFSSNWINDQYSQYNEFQSILLFQDLVGSVSLQSITFQNHLGSGNSITAGIESVGIQSSLMLFKNALLDTFVCSQVAFLSNKAQQGPLNLGQIQPTLFQLDYSSFSALATEIVLTQLTLNSNTFYNSNYAVLLQLNNLVFNNPTIIVNDCFGSVIQIQFPANNSTVTFIGGFINGNTVGTGAVLTVTDASDGQYDIPTNPMTNLYFQNTVFNSNSNIIGVIGSVTSCLLVLQTQDYDYLWMTILFYNVQFLQNQGALTNDIYFADSMVLNAQIQSCTWDVSIGTLTPGKLAQIIYKNDENALFSITNSIISCSGQTYDSDIIMTYDSLSTEGRPGLFRMIDLSGNQILPQLNPTPYLLQSNGTLDPTQFRNQFSGNQYLNCNNIIRGAIYYLEYGARLYETQSSFTDNSAIQGGIAYLIGDGTYLALDSLKYPFITNSFSYYGAVMYAAEGATAQISSTAQINHSSAFEGVLAYLINRSRLVMYEQTTVANNIINKRGLITALSGSQFWIQDTSFISNNAALDTALVFAEGCREMYNLVNGDTTISFGISYVLKSYIINSSIQTPFAARGRIITLIDSFLVLQGVNFVSGSYPDVNQRIYVFDGDLVVTNSVFQGQDKSNFYNTLNNNNNLQGTGNGAFISLYGLSTMNIQGSMFNGTKSNYGGCIFIMGPSNTTITNTNFTYCAAMLGGAIYANEFLSLTLSKTTFVENFAHQGYGQNIYAQGVISSLKISFSSFTSYHNSIYFNGLSLAIQNCQFQGDGRTSSEVVGLNARANGAGLYILNAYQVILQQTSFTQMVGSKGGAIYIEEQPNALLAMQLNFYSKYLVSFDTITVNNCTAQEDGGGFYMKNTQNPTISGANIQGQATGNGGGIAFNCDQNLMTGCNLKLNQNTFSKCSSSVGGGVYWNLIEPQMQPTNGKFIVRGKIDKIYVQGTNSFIGCNAIAYGPQISGVPQQIISISQETYQIYYTGNFNRQGEYMNDATKLTDIQLGSVQSGGYIPTRYYAMIDKYYQVVNNYVGGKISFNLIGPASSGNFTTMLIGVKDFYSVNGVFNASLIGIYSGPNITITSSMTVNPIIGFNQVVKLSMDVRPCEIGESLKPSGQCILCAGGSFLLFAPKVPKECDLCTENMICLGGQDIGPKPGYWRRNQTTIDMIPCYFKEACLGLDVTADQINRTQPGVYEGHCNITQGYYGALCSGCQPGFKRLNDYECSACDAKYEIYYVIGTLVFVIAVVIYFVHITIKGATSEDNTALVFIKIMINHMQLLIITQSFDLNWPKEVNYIFLIAEPIRQVYLSIISFDCWMDTRVLPDQNTDPYAFTETIYTFTANPTEWRVIYQKALILAGIPIFLCITSYAIWWIILKSQRRSNEQFTKFISTIVILLFIVHPQITSNMVDMFNCQKFDGQNRLKIDLQVICFEGFHAYFTWYMALPCIIIWGVGIPAIIFVLIQKDSEMLETNSVKEKYGFFYNGYKRQNYFWEIIIMYRKILCIVLSIFLRQVGLIVQALVLLIILVVFMQANSQRRPYSARALNDLESMSIISQIVTIYCGIFFVSSQDPNSSSFNPNQDFFLDSNGEKVFIVVIALCNGAFVILWLTKFTQVLRILIKEKYPKMYVIMFLCGRDDKLSLETAKRAKDSKKEAIIECIETVVLYMTKMKSLYADQVFYEDHNRFLKLIYYIEAERLQIDLTEKKHNYYIQGQLSRLRKFDPVIIMEKNNLGELPVNEIGQREIQIREQQQRVLQDSHQMTTSTLLQGITKLREQHQVPQTQRQQGSDKKINAVAPTYEENKNQQTVRSQGDQIRGQIYNVTVTDVSGDDLEIADGDGFSLMTGQKPPKKPTRKQKKPNVADLTTIYNKTRQNQFQIPVEKKKRIKLADLNADGQIIDRYVFPEGLKGFNTYEDVREIDNSDQSSHDTIQSNLKVIRKLTDRMASPEKVITLGKKSHKQDEDQASDIEGLTLNDTSQNPSVITGITHSVSLKVYKKGTQQSDEIEGQGVLTNLGPKEIVVQKGETKGDQNNYEEEKEEVAVRKRPKRGARVEYRQDGMIVEHMAQVTIDPNQEDLNDQLMVTILDNDDDLINPTKKSAGSKKTSEHFKTIEKSLSIESEENKPQQSGQDSFKTDSSMREYSDPERAEVENQDFFKKSQLGQDGMGEGLGVRNRRSGQAGVLVLNESDQQDSQRSINDRASLIGNDFYQAGKSRNN